MLTSSCGGFGKAIDCSPDPSWDCPADALDASSSTSLPLSRTKSCRTRQRLVGTWASADLAWCSHIAHSQPLLGRTSAATASCLLARGRPVQVHPLGPQIIPRSRETRLGSLVDTMRQKRTGPRIGVKCKPAEQKGIQNVLRSPVIFRRVQWMWRLGSQSLICPTVQIAAGHACSESGLHAVGGPKFPCLHVIHNPPAAAQGGAVGLGTG